MNKRNSFYNQEEIKQLGFKHIGKNVLISKHACFYTPEEIIIGNNVRIDDFCILSGKITIGNYIHIAAYSALYGGNKGITIYDFANLSSRITIYAKSDDYSGETMSNPLIPEKYKNVNQEEVIIHKHVIIGSGSIVLPGVIIHEGCSIGSLSLVTKTLDPWTINAGIPAKKIKERSKNLLILEQKFLHERNKTN